MFVKGQKGGPGRPKASANKYTGDMRVFCRSLIENPTYRKDLEVKFKDGKQTPAMEQMVWYYAYGKPKETLEANWNLEKLTDEQLRNLEALVTRIA